MTKVYIGADHGGFELKQQLIAWFRENGLAVEDCGAFILDANDDYPDFAFAVAEQVAADTTGQALGVILCRTSAGVVIAANKVAGIRAASASTPDLARLVRSHNNANVLGLGADSLDFNQARDIVKSFLDTEFSSDERHQRRVLKIETHT